MRHEIELLSKLVTESTLPDWDSISAIVGRSTQVCIAKWEGTLHPKLLRMELSRAASEYRRDHTSLSIAFGPCVTVRKKASGPTEDVAATRSPIREGSPSSIGVGCPSQSSKPIATRKEDRRSTSSSFIWRGTFSDVCIPRRTCWTHKEKSELRNLLALPDPPPWKDIAFVVGHTVEACKERSTRKRRTWTPKQDQQLMSSRSCQPRPSWEETASQIGYSANACKQRFAQYLRSQPARLFWTTEQECLLQNACAKELNLTWNQIAHAVGHGRTARACETRYCEMRARLTWKPEEDQKLRDLRACVPPTCWKEISKEFGRSSSECERRIAHLRLTSGQGRKTSQRQPLRVYPLYLPRSTDVENNCLQGDNIALADSIAASTDVEALEGPSEPPAVKATCTDIADKRPHYTGTRQAWTREEEQRLVKCRVEGQISWSETARIVGRSETSCQTKLYQLLEQIRRSKSNLADQTSPSNSAEEPAVSDVSHLDKEPSFRTRWTPEESERLRKSRASRPLPKWERTAQIVGRPSKACRMHYANLQKAGLSEPTTVPSEDQDVETGSGGQVSDVSVADAARLSLRWSEEEKEALLKSRACRPLPSWQQTAGAVGRPSASCQQMYFKLKRHLLADPAVAPVGDSLPLEDATHPAHGDTVMRNQDADGYSAQAQAGLGEPLEEPSLVVVQELKSGLDISNMAESAPVAAPPAAGSMTHWTQEEHRILNECLARRPHLSWDKIAEIVGRSETSCRAKTKTLKRISLEQAPEGEDRPAYARRPHLKRPWKPREEKRLLEGRANTPQLTWADIGKSLSRTANACQIRWTQIHDRRGL
jgi:DNA-binding Lrp family transcriptional regulator